MQAARNDDAEAIGRALRAGVDPNTKDGETGRTLAIEAARHGAVNALALLLAATEGAEEQRTESSVTARGGDGGWFVHAQKWESPLWQYSDDGWSPLMHAVSCGQLACARMLVEAGADVYLTDYDGVDAARLAVATPDAQLTREMLTLLIERGGFVAGGADDDTGEHALLHAARNANAAACDVLLRAGTGPAKLNKPNKDGESALLLASRAGGADAVRTMLAFAVERRDVVQCKLLTEHKTGDNAIHAAVRARAVDCVRELVRPLLDVRAPEDAAELRRILAASLARPNRKERQTPRELAEAMASEGGPDAERARQAAAALAQAEASAQNL